MKIVLNSSLEKKDASRNYRSLDIDRLSNRIGYRLGGAVRYLYSSLTPETEKQLGFVETLSIAYSLHEKVEIHPHDIWFIVLGEIAQIVNKNAEQCRTLFTRSNDKVDIKIPVLDVTDIDLTFVVSKLKDLIPANVNAFVPHLYAIPDHARLALYAALCDTVSSYYSYSTFCCGIPEIKLAGILDDWITLKECAEEISSLFASVNLTSASDYMKGVTGIFQEILKTFVDGNLSFWKNIFTQCNVGSGGELEINGWITSLFHEKRKLNKLENFLTNSATVNYINLDTGRKYKGVYGAFERTRTEDDYLRAGYGGLIYETR